MHALLGSTHPLGQLREDLLRLFEERLRTGIGPAEWGADVHALLDVLQRCTFESCLLRANDRSGKFQVCECVERAAFEGNIAGAQEKVETRFLQAPSSPIAYCLLPPCSPSKPQTAHIHPIPLNFSILLGDVYPFPLVPLSPCLLRHLPLPCTQPHRSALQVLRCCLNGASRIHRGQNLCIPAHPGLNFRRSCPAKTEDSSDELSHITLELKVACEAHILGVQFRRSLFVKACSSITPSRASVSLCSRKTRCTHWTIHLW